MKQPEEGTKPDTGEGRATPEPAQGEGKAVQPMAGFKAAIAKLREPVKHPEAAGETDKAEVSRTGQESGPAPEPGKTTSQSAGVVQQALPLAGAQSRAAATAADVSAATPADKADWPAGSAPQQGTSAAREADLPPAADQASDGSAKKAKSSRPRRRTWPLWARILVFVLGVPVLLTALLYGRLAFGPVDLSFAKPNIEQMIRDGLPSDSAVELGDLSLSLSARFTPVLHFAPVTFTDTRSGAMVSTDALEIGVSLQALIGQPAAVVSLINPRLQILQDLLGPRLVSFSERRDPDTGETIIEVKQGKDIYPEVRIGANGLQVSGPSPRSDGVGLRSDNDWLIYNLEGADHAIAALEEQAKHGQFARLEVHGGTMEIVEPVFGKARRFDNLEMVLKPGSGNRPTKGTLGATLADRQIEGTFERQTEADGAGQVSFAFQNLDFAALIPVLDDPTSLMALRGGGTLDGTLRYDPAGAITHGQFNIDVGNTEFRLRHEYFPVGKGKLSLDWDPKTGRFELARAEVAIGKTTTTLEGEIVLGLDDVYGPTVGASLNLTDLYLAPNDLPAPETPFSKVSIKAWAAPLYGAIGLDRAVAEKPGVEIRAKGRFDMVRSGIGVDLEVGGEGASADDLKRLWPYFVARGGRDWFVGHVTAGHIKTGSLRFKLPVGALDPDVDDQPLSPNSAWIDLIGKDVTVIPTEGFTPVVLGGDAKLSLRDNKTSVTIDTTQIVSDKGRFTFSNGAVEIDAGDPEQTVIEFSGDVNGGIPALIGFAESQSPGVIEGFGLPFDARKLKGSVDGSAVVTMTFGDGPDPLAIDYAVNGAAHDFVSGEPIADRAIANGQLTFQATPDAYHVAGTADLDGVPAELVLDGSLDSTPEIKVASTVDVADFQKFGFDLSELMSGKIRFVAKPLEDGSLQLAADLTEARLSFKDIGLSKAAGTPGTLDAEILSEGTLTKVSRIDLKFGQVRVKGDLEYDSVNGLVSADFSDFALSQGDSASLIVKPGKTSGFDVAISGEQFDLKPMLKRYFALDKTSTGSPQAKAVPEELVVSAKLKQALGYYGVTAYNVEFALDIRGEDVLDASLQGQFAEGNSVSLISNPTTGGRLMTVAFNDAGTLMRFLNVYPRVLGGSGSLTLRTNVRERIDYGEIRMKNFAIVDEEKVAEIIGNHKDSQKLIAEGNRLSFQSGQVTFIRRSDRIEVTDAVLDGGSIGGTLKGFVYTKARQYDLTGTYIPLFGLNNLFQRLPIIGTILGGRSGEGLVGVTFAVRGDLDKPEFVVNPVSILAPGVFRSLFEFRATEAPREEQPVQ